MVNYIFIGLYVLAAAVLVYLFLDLKKKKDNLSKRETILENKQAELLQQQNLLTAEQLTHESNVRAFKEIAVDAYTELSASYAVSDSDAMKYKTDKAIANVAKNRIAHIISNDIIRRFEPMKEIRDGHEIYTYKLKVKE